MLFTDAFVNGVGTCSVRSWWIPLRPAGPGADSDGAA